MKKYKYLSDLDTFGLQFMHPIGLFYHQYCTSGQSPFCTYCSFKKINQMSY